MPFRRQVAGFERLREEFEGRVTFVIVYQREAHAGQRVFMDIEQPRTSLGRRKLAKALCSELGIEATVVVDNMMDSARKAYGSLYNMAYIIDTKGKVVHKEMWADPSGWPEILAELVAGE